jgi:hypothetical protein
MAKKTGLEAGFFVLRLRCGESQPLRATWFSRSKSM